MNINEILSSCRLPTLEVELILAHCLQKERSWILSHDDEKLNESDAIRINTGLQRRLDGEPLAYITGKKEFYGREFIVNRDVMIPRPSTECLVDLAREYMNEPADKITDADKGIVCVSKILKAGLPVRQAGIRPKTIVDIGTGSGCIAISLALELPQARIIATDISRSALKTARLNAERFGLRDRIDFREGNLLEPLTGFSDDFLIVSNPPYVPLDAQKEEELRFEPKNAIFAGEDGMDVIRPLMESAANHPYCAGFVIECMGHET